MKFSLVLLVALALVACVAADSSAKKYTYDTEFEADLQYTQFMDYTRRFNKKYSTVEEFVERFGHFKESVARIAKRNAEHEGSVFGLTKFSDMSPEEFRAQYLTFNPHLFPALPSARIAKAPAVAAANTTFDWRTKGAVTPVKDQQQCGSCWAFSATETIESAWFLAGNQLVELSPQQIVSCDTTDSGCDGGWPTGAYGYVQQQGGLELDSDYPYTSGGGDSGTCQVDTTKLVAKVSGFEYANPPCQDSCDSQDETTLINSLVAKGPVSVCVDASSWSDYSGGVLKSQCPHDYSDLDHCVQLVGYNFSGSTKYYIVRNSWNTDWGEQGFIYIEYGSNLCGIADVTTIPTI